MELYETEKLWEKDNWTNANIHYLFNHIITEYDMKSAGLSLIKEYGLLPEKVIKKLDSLPNKETLNTRIGLMEKSDKELVKRKKIAFASAREQFIRGNKLESLDIIDIRKDAIFTTRECKYTHFGTYINFVPKNQYTSFLRIGKRAIEVFYNSGEIDVKGIGDELLPLHNDGMISLFRKFFKMMETDNAENTLRFLRRTIDSYKALELPVDYYREFNAKSAFVTNEGLEMMDYWEEHKDELKIDYNYMILLNLSKILL